MGSRVFVGGLPFATGEDALRDLFASHGNVTSVQVVTDKLTGRSRGFAFVEMSSQSEVQKAISMFSGYTLNERQLTVNVARPREERRDGGSHQQHRNRNNPNKRRY